MAKKLTTQQRIQRARAEGFSRKQLASAFGVSVSAIGRAERGQSSGATVEKQAAQFSRLGKRSKASVVSGQVSLPSAPQKRATGKRRAKEAAPRILDSPLERAKGQLSFLRKAGVEKVMIHITSKKTGRSRTLFAHGGVDSGSLGGFSGGLAGAIAGQGGSQYDDDTDWYDYSWMDSIDVEEYY
jgi:transcriptional regulator with XRE-family HTH domain